MPSVKVLCADLPGLIKRMVCALCETNIAYNTSIEITGSLHIKADDTRVVALLFDHVASKRPPSIDCDDAPNGRQQHAVYGVSPGGPSPPLYDTPAQRRADDTPKYAARSPVSQPRGSMQSYNAARSQRYDTPSSCGEGSKRARLPPVDSATADCWQMSRDSVRARDAMSHDLPRRRADSREHAIALGPCSPPPSTTAVTDAPAGSSAAGMSLSQLARRLSETAAPRGPAAGGSHNAYPKAAMPVPTEQRCAEARDHLGDISRMSSRTSSEVTASGGSVLTPVTSASSAQGIPPATIAPASAGPPALLSQQQLYGAASMKPVPPMGGWVHAYRSIYQKVHRKNGLNCHTCTLCGMHFQRAPSLAAHINAIHTRERSFKCEICSKVFFRRTAYCNHRRAHHQPGPLFTAAAPDDQHQRDGNSATVIDDDEMNASTLDSKNILHDSVLLDDSAYEAVSAAVAMSSTLANSRITQGEVNLIDSDPEDTGIKAVQPQVKLEF